MSPDEARVPPGPVDSDGKRISSMNVLAMELAIPLLSQGVGGRGVHLPGDADQRDIVNSLKSIPLFNTLSPRQLKVIAKTAKERSYRAGESIVKQGVTGIGLFLILEGKVGVYRSGGLVATLPAGQFFGEMALLDEQPRSADVRAATNARCLVLSPWEFWSTAGKDPEVLRLLLRETVRRLRSAAPSASD